jgi:alkylresorcinol/alkylpyrone synthase
MAEEAIARALHGAGLSATDIDHLFFVTVTGITTPSLEAMLAERVGLRPDVKRTPMFGLGCVSMDDIITNSPPSPAICAVSTPYR